GCFPLCPQTIGTGAKYPQNSPPWHTLAIYGLSSWVRHPIATQFCSKPRVKDLWFAPPVFPSYAFPVCPYLNLLFVQPCLGRHSYYSLVFLKHLHGLEQLRFGRAGGDCEHFGDLLVIITLDGMEQKDRLAARLKRIDELMHIFHIQPTTTALR